MLKKLRQQQKGFTIIEVLIVLAIAGLILLIVFLAVPALQRNARNTQRKDDVARIGGAVQEVLNNNNGSLASLTSANLQSTVGSQLSHYQQANVTVSGAAPAAPTNGTTVDTVNVYTDATCGNLGGGGQGATSFGATTREIAITYTVETGGGTAKVCSGL